MSSKVRACYPATSGAQGEELSIAPNAGDHKDIAAFKKATKSRARSLGFRGGEMPCGKVPSLG